MKGPLNLDTPTGEQARSTLNGTSRFRKMIYLGGAALCWMGWASLPWYQGTSHEAELSRIQTCSIKNFQSDLYFLETAEPIPASEFIGRRDALARALHATSIPAFVMEPGYTTQYYANLSQFDWEPWEPEERPMLIIVRPDELENGTIVARTSILAPSFEVGRVRMLGIPGFGDEDTVVGWEEHWDPYITLRESEIFADAESESDVIVMMDEEIRDYIVRGLDRSGFETLGLGGEVEAVRQVKTPREIELLRAVNTGTVEAVRAMRKCLIPGVTEDEVTKILDNTMESIGFKSFFDIVLFEEDGALPHGGFVTGGKVLNEETMVVIDVGAHYLGYSSDICRSFFIPAQEKSWTSRFLPPWLSGSRTAPSQTLASSELHAEKLKVWDVVLRAQTESAKHFKPNSTAASVDIAARDVISEAGYGQYFTHRVGHGIGIKAHESPYLNKGNNGTLLRAGMTFTSEPGIYVLGKFGVRHEDIFHVKEDGEAEVLTGKRAVSPWEP